MEHTSQLQRKPEHEDENSSKEDTSYSSVESLLEHSGQSGSIKPRSVAMSSSDLTVQKKSSAGSAMSNVGKAGGAAVGRAGKITGSSGAVKTQPTYVKSKTVIVEDDQKPSGVQMTKSKFLAALDKSVRATADPLLAKKGTSTDNCPWLYWAFTYYEYMSGAAEIQTALNTYITTTQGASSATDLISKVSAYVKTHVAYWVKTGKVTGVPKDLMGQLPTVKQAASSKTIQKKGTGAMDAGDSGSAQSVHHQLEGGGQSLSGSVRSQMESALGTDLSGVKIHTGGEAGSIASEQNAKALTVGQHIAFGSGEYQPGTMHGDALLAHELAHTIQQRGATESVQSKEENPVSYNALEHDADNAAVSAVSGIWGSTKEWASKLGKKTGAALRSGLQLQKCGGNTTTSPKTYDECITEGQKKYREKKFEEAADFYDQAEALAGTDADKKKKATYKKLMALGNADRVKGNYDTAISFFEEARGYASDDREKGFVDGDIKQTKQEELNSTNDRVYQAPPTSTFTFDSDETLKLMDYAKLLNDTGQPEKAADSKEKASKVINAWKAGHPYAVMTVKLKTALVLELQVAPITPDDQKLIDDLNKNYEHQAATDQSFSDETVQSVFDQVYRNKLPTCTNPRDCITTVRDIVLNTLFASKSKVEKTRINDKIESYANQTVPTGPNQGKIWNRMEDSMHGLEDAGYAYELLDDEKRPITFIKEPGGNLLQNHPTAWKRIQNDLGDQTGWFVYGLALAKSYHSVTVFVKKTDQGETIYIVDNHDHSEDHSGYYDFEGNIPGVREINNGGDFDRFVDYANTSYGMNLMPDLFSQLWRILPDKKS